MVYLTLRVFSDRSCPDCKIWLFFWELPWLSYDILQSKNSVTLETSISLTLIGNRCQLCLIKFSFQIFLECHHLCLSSLSSFEYKVPQLARPYYSYSLYPCATIMILLQSISDHITPLTLNSYTASDFSEQILNMAHKLCRISFPCLLVTHPTPCCCLCFAHTLLFVTPLNVNVLVPGSSLAFHTF